MFPSEEAISIARYMEPRISNCDEYEDAWVFSNPNKARNEYNPIVIMKKDYDAVPFSIYRMENAGQRVIARYTIYDTDDGKKIHVDGGKLKELRKKLSLTQGALARELGFTASVISNVEKGRIVSMDNLRKVAEWMTENSDT